VPSRHEVPSQLNNFKMAAKNPKRGPKARSHFELS
jgi:hypothetical protein